MESADSRAAQGAELRNTTELKIESHGRSLPSIKHPERNEDAIAHNSASGVAALFDGMGGVANGELAAKTARGFVVERLKAINSSAPEIVKDQVRGILIEASSAVGREARGGVQQRLL